MSPAASNTADQLLPRDLQEPFKTGEVLELEYKLIHGRDEWDPPDGTQDNVREQLIAQAKAHSPNNEADQAEAQRLALHAWSVRNLPGPGQAGLCLSGGGIRSASFCLGILQALAKRGLLSQFDYLSTVSGGGYIGSWLSAWRVHWGQNIHDIETSLAGENEPDQVKRLRDFTSYLTPLDTCNLVLNWILFCPSFCCL